MFDQKKHSVTGRIVSISQPHVRPIVRGKAKAVYKAILQEAREDEKQRVLIEGVFGRAKRKYGMGLIKEKLQNTSENTLTMIILEMNLEKIPKVFLEYLRIIFVLFYWFFGKVIFQPIFRWKLAEKS